MKQNFSKMYDEAVIESIKDKLIKAKQSLAVAESVTAGHMQAAISSATMASEFFQGGITVYNLGQKTRQLDVEPIHADTTNCVSDRISTQMAIAVNRKFLSDYGISITGYATTMPEKGINELFAWFSISCKNEILVSKRITSVRKNSVEVQIDYTNQVLKEFEQVINRR